MLDEHLGKRGVESFEIKSFIRNEPHSKLYNVQSKINQRFYTMEVSIKKTPSVKYQPNIILIPRTRVSRYFIRFRYYFSTKCRHFVILDSIVKNNQTLKDILISSGSLPGTVVKYIAANLIVALKELHRHHRTYKVLCPDNVLIRNDGSITVKRTYFGTSYWTKEECLECYQSKLIDTKCTLCQSNRDKEQDEKLDWLSLGTLICIMLTTFTPFDSKFTDVSSTIDYLRPLLKRPLPPYCLPKSLSDDACVLISRLLDTESQNCSKVLTNQAFFTNIDWRKARNSSLEIPYLLKSSEHPTPMIPCNEVITTGINENSRLDEISEIKDITSENLTKKIEEAEELLRSAKERLERNPIELNMHKSMEFKNSPTLLKMDTEKYNKSMEGLKNKEGLINNEHSNIDSILERAKQISLVSILSSPSKKEIKQLLYGQSDVLKKIIEKYGLDIDDDSINEIDISHNKGVDEVCISRDFIDNEADENNEGIYCKDKANTVVSKSCEEVALYSSQSENRFKAVYKSKEHEDYQEYVDSKVSNNHGSGLIIPKLLIENTELASEKDGVNLLKINGMVREANIINSTELNVHNIDSIEDISRTIESQQNIIVDNKMIQGIGNPFITQHKLPDPSSSSSSSPSTATDPNCLNMVVNELDTRGYTTCQRSGSFDCTRALTSVVSDEALYPHSSSDNHFTRIRSASLMTPTTESNNNNSNATNELLDKLRVLGHLSYGRKLSPRLSSSTASLQRSSPRPRHKIFHIGDNGTNGNNHQDKFHNSEIDISKSNIVQGEKPCSPIRTMSYTSSTGVDEIQESIIKRSQLYRTTSGVRNFKEKEALSRSYSAGCHVDPKLSLSDCKESIKRSNGDQNANSSCVTEIKETIFSTECATVETTPWTPTPTPDPTPKIEKTRKTSIINRPSKNADKNNNKQRRISHSKAFFQEALNLNRNDSTGSLESSIWKQRLPMRRKSVAVVCDCKSCGKSMTMAEKKLSKDLICTKCQSVRTERKEAIMELIQTEVNFGEDLWILKEEFQLPMKTGGILNQEHLSAVFVNLQELIDVNSKLCATVQDGLQDCLGKGDQEFLTLEVGKVFLDNVEFLQAFEQFCSRQHQAIATIEILQKKSEILRVFLNVSRKENTKLRKMDLKSFLAMPVQRIMKYPLLLNRIYKATPPDHSDREAIRHAQKRIEELISNTNEISKGKTPRLRKSRSTNTLHRADSSDTKQMIKTVAELLNWKVEETMIALNSHFEVCPADLIGCDDAAKIRSKKTVRVNALLCIRGVEEGFDIDGSTSSISMDTHDAVVILLKKKVPNKCSVYRGPICLKECVFSCHEDIYFRDMFELLPMNSDPLTLVGENIEEVTRWKHAISWLIDDLAAWRFRRNAMANIMLKSLS